MTGRRRALSATPWALVWPHLVSGSWLVAVFGLIAFMVAAAASASLADGDVGSIALAVAVFAFSLVMVAVGAAGWALGRATFATQRARGHLFELDPERERLIDLRPGFADIDFNSIERTDRHRSRHVECVIVARTDVPGPDAAWVHFAESVLYSLSHLRKKPRDRTWRAIPALRDRDALAGTVDLPPR